MCFCYPSGLVEDTYWTSHNITIDSVQMHPRAFQRNQTEWAAKWILAWNEMSATNTSLFSFAVASSQFFRFSAWGHSQGLFCWNGWDAAGAQQNLTQLPVLVSQPKALQSCHFCRALNLKLLMNTPIGWNVNWQQFWSVRIHKKTWNWKICQSNK